LFPIKLSEEGGIIIKGIHCYSFFFRIKLTRIERGQMKYNSE
jgi:hypothetical protein